MTRSITTPKIDVGTGKVNERNVSFVSSCSAQVSPRRGVMNINVATVIET